MVLNSRPLMNESIKKVGIELLGQLKIELLVCIYEVSRKQTSNFRYANMDFCEKPRIQI